MEPQDAEGTPGTQAPCCCGGAPKDGAAAGGTGAACCGGTTASGSCPARTILVALVILAALGLGIWSLVAS